MKPTISQSYNDFFNDIHGDLLKKAKNNKTTVEKKALSYGISDKNTVKEITENAIVTIARNIANQPNKTNEQKYLEIVELYNSQVNLSHRTSQSMLLQQYSTPATISYLLGLYCQIDKIGTFYEASAGNGMLTIASNGSNFIVNEIDDVRNTNLHFQNIFKEITKLDSSSKTFKAKSFDAVLTNPPFGKLDKDEYLEIDGFTVKELDHKMSILALNSMQDNGRAGIIIGGHTKWDERGRIQSGKNRTFLSYLYRNYFVEDVININSKNLYSRMGTGFDVRAILINGRRTEEKGMPLLKQYTNTDIVNTHEELYQRISNHIKTTKMDLLRRANAIKERNQSLIKHSSEKGLKSPYIPASESCFTLEVNTPDSMSDEIHKAIRDIKKDVGGNLNEYLTEKLNYKDEKALCKALASEQIDGVSTAVYNIEKKSQGIIIGDQTGIGKGRQAAAIIRYAKENDYMPIFLTEKPNLFSDLYRDLEDIDSAQYKPFIVNAKSSKTKIKNNAGKVIAEAPPKTEQEKAFKKGIVPKGYDFVVATYSQFASSTPTVKQAFLRAISKDAIIIMDESHNASGSSATGEFLKDVVKLSKSTIFLSATFAKRPDNMPIYALKTSIKDANMNDEDLVNAIQSGGVALQEVLASQLVSVGQMIRRERTYEGIDVNYITLDRKAKEHSKIADGVTQIIRRIISFQANNIDDMVSELDKIASAEMKDVELTKGTKGAGVDNSPYFSRVFNVINQMLFSIKADEVAERAIMRLKEGKKPVIAFSNTMGAFIDELQDGDLVDADFKEVLKRGLNSVLSYTTTDMTGNKVKEYFSPSEMSLEARSEYYDILRDIESVSTGIVISPIDHIVQKLQDAGYTTAEVTGRSKRVELSYNKDGSIVGEIQVRKKENTNDAFRKFNNNEVDVLLINQSGSTGASAHAVPTNKVPESEVKQRVMIVLQAELNINTEVQKRGRINRTGQILKPVYDYVASAIPAEKRLQMMLQKKLKSLDANTTSNQKNSEDLMKSDDFLNKYGDEVVKTWLEENPEMNRLLGNLITKDTTTFENISHKTSGRVAILPVKDQEEFYKTILQNYHDEIARLLQRGLYDLELEDVNLEAKTITKDIAVVGRNSKSVFGGNTYFEKVEVNNLRKPYIKKEVDEIISNTLNGKTAEEYQQELKDQYNEYIETELSVIFVDKSKKWEKVIGNIRKEKAYHEATNLNEYYDSRLKEITEAKFKDIKDSQEKFRNQTDGVKQFLNFFYIGKPLNYPTLDFGTGKQSVESICIDVSFNKKASNPFAPSNISFSFATADSNRRFDLKASNKFLQEINSIIGASHHVSSYRQNEILNEWDSKIQESTANRTHRYVVTGNILQGYAKYNNGKLISYTLQGGGTQKGILLPLHYNPRDEKNRTDAYVNVPILMVLKMIRSASAGASFNTNSDISLQRYHNEVKLYVPASKSKGGKYFLDEEILYLTQTKNFDKVSSKMVAMIDDENLEELLRILQDKHGVSALVLKSRIDEIQEVQEAIENAKKQETNNNGAGHKAKVLKLKAKAILIKQKQLKLKIARLKSA